MRLHRQPELPASDANPCNHQARNPSPRRSQTIKSTYRLQSLSPGIAGTLLRRGLAAGDVGVIRSLLSRHDKGRFVGQLRGSERARSKDGDRDYRSSNRKMMMSDAGSSLFKDRGYRESEVGMGKRMDDGGFENGDAKREVAEVVDGRRDTFWRRRAQPKQAARASQPVSDQQRLI